MRYKKLTLIKENLEDYSWYIQIIVNRDGLVRGNSSICTSTQKKNWQKYYETHKKEEYIRTRKWLSENPDKVKMYQEKYNFSDLDKRREQYRRSKRKTYPRRKAQELARNAYRRYEMGFEQLNTPIEGIKCDGHHIDKEHILYMPSIIHNVIFHNLKTGKNMNLINSIAEGFR